MNTQEKKLTREELIKNISSNAEWTVIDEKGAGGYKFSYFINFLDACSTDFLVLIEKLNHDSIFTINVDGQMVGFSIHIKIRENVFLSITLLEHIALFKFCGDYCPEYTALYINESALMYDKIMTEIGGRLLQEIEWILKKRGTNPDYRGWGIFTAIPRVGMRSFLRELPFELLKQYPILRRLPFVSEGTRKYYERWY